MRVIGYCRTSKDSQGLSPAAQETSIRSWCRAAGCEPAAVFVDVGVSSVSAIEERPGLAAALSALRKGDALLVAKRDRIARDPIIAAQVEYLARRVGARLVSADGREGASQLESTIQRCVDDMVAAVELHRIRTRTREALAAKRAKGERTGSVPYGFALAADRVKLVPVATEQAVIATARAMHAEGYSLRDIAREFAARGHFSRTGRVFQAVQVSRMVARDFVAVAEAVA